MSFSNDLVASVAAGVTSRLVIQPIDIVKIRLQTDANFTTATKVTRSIWKNEGGLRGFFKGHTTGQILYLAWAIEAPIFYYINREILPSSKFGSGVLTGCVCTVLLTWLDSLRTNLANLKQSNRAYADLKSVLKTTQGKGLFQGIIPGMLMYGPGTAIIFTTYHYLRDIYKLESYYSGFIAGIVVRLALCPLDVTKKRMQIENLHQRRPMRRMVSDIFKKEGFRGFWKGSAISILKSGIANGVRFCVLDALRTSTQSVQKPSS